MYVVSACLTGIKCKYSGGDNYSEDVMQFLCGCRYVTVCPEELGGLPTPRVPSEICGDRVMNSEGRDVTAEFTLGAERALESALSESTAMGEQIEAGIFKQRSPSCGCGMVYDGTFSGRLVPGDGITAALFRKNGIKIFNENDISRILRVK